MASHLLLVHALSPLHAGTGQGVGVIDLPIARETATGLPYLPGSSLKGTLRDRCADASKRKAIFGPEQTQAHEHAGAAVFSDQRLLLLPVRSLYGVFAWVTCPLVLQRFVRDCQDAGVIPLPALPATPRVVETLATTIVEAKIASDSTVKGQVGTAAQRTELICLEDLDLTPGEDTQVTSLATWLGERLFPNDPTWQKSLKERLCVIPDDVFSYLLETATEVTARIRLEDNSKTVANGALWYEESLPGESVLYGLIASLPNGKTGMGETAIQRELSSLCQTPLQLGGKANVGRGLCRLRLVGGQ